jgi:hypothetical protein
MAEPRQLRPLIRQQFSVERRERITRLKVVPNTCRISILRDAEVPCPTAGRVWLRSSIAPPTTINSPFMPSGGRDFRNDRKV